MIALLMNHRIHWGLGGAWIWSSAKGRGTVACLGIVLVKVNADFKRENFNVINNKPLF